MLFGLFGHKNKTRRTLARLAGVRLESGRDRAGFSFGAILRSAPRPTTTVCFKVDNPDEVGSELLLQWENAIAEDESVLASAYTVDSTGSYMAVTFKQIDKAERKDDGQALTRLAATLPDVYEFNDVVSTPMTAEDIYDRVVEAVGTQGGTWPEMQVGTVDETVNAVAFDAVNAVSFDAMDDADLDGLLRELVLDDELAGVARWTRIFRPGLEAEEEDLGRHSGVLTVSAEASRAQVENVAAALLNQLSAVERLRVRRIYGRQMSGFLAGLGIGDLVWDAEKVTV